MVNHLVHAHRIMSLPPKLSLTGRHRRLYGWLNRLLDVISRGKLLTTPDIRVQQTPGGVHLFLNGKSGGSGSTVKAFSVFEITADSLKCYALDSSGNEITGTTYWVGKPYHLGEGRLVSDGTNNLDRLEDVAGESERQKRLAIYDFDGTELESEEAVIPAYSVGSVIVAARAPIGLNHKEDTSGSTAESIEWIDLNRDARRWRMKHVHAAVCVENVTKNQVIQGGTISD